MMKVSLRASYSKHDDSGLGSTATDVGREFDWVMIIIQRIGNLNGW